MIFNRTADDVTRAAEIRKRIQNGETITNAEVEILERGMLTVNSINRISEKQAELKNSLDSFAYFCNDVSVKSWSFADIFKAKDFQNLIDNLTVLRNAFYVFYKTPKNPSPKFHFSNINDLEKILFDLDSNLKYMVANFRDCGNYQCGE